MKYIVLFLFNRFLINFFYLGVQFCHVYNIDEEKFLESWVAYTITHSLDINPTINNLIQFENEELKKNSECVVTQDISNIHTLDIQPKEDIMYPFIYIYHI